VGVPWRDNGTGHRKGFCTDRDLIIVLGLETSTLLATSPSSHSVQSPKHVFKRALQNPLMVFYPHKLKPPSILSNVHLRSRVVQ
jgi:hypothetical protein